MESYIETLRPEVKEFLRILSPEGIPEFLDQYIETPEMKKQGKISTTCGTIYSKMFPIQFWNSSLTHSIAVALIVWNFTKDTKQTLAGLFHDIATPAFKHTIDFMNGDYETQESTEELTSKILEESEEIMTLLRRDGIKREEVEDYHKFPIADNNIPQLSSDRLAYTLLDGLGAIIKVWTIEEVRQIYQDIEVQKNEEGIEELGFKTLNIAEKFIHGMSQIFCEYIKNRTKFSMQFLADIMKKMLELKRINKEDLYNLSEEEVIEKIENCDQENIAKNFSIWRNATRIEESDDKVADQYCVSIEKPKIRYIVPLVRQGKEFVRIDKLSVVAKQDIEKTKNFKTKKYAYLNFNF